ncbi:MAG: hypothetical protein CSA82_03625 [Actinobacteria bacterium]|nr:MAG: hypothetical protein CSA82_03625 [Actinomycetota bacterium]
MPRIFTLAAAIAFVLSGCTLPTPDSSVFEQSASGKDAFWEKNSAQSSGESPTLAGAPYPADMEHLNEIIALTDAKGLPEGATDIAVAPARKFAASYPGGWGYVISFHAEEQAIRDYFGKHTTFDGDDIELFDDAEPNNQFEDIDISTINHPLVTGFDSSTQIALERPLGRCWLLIRGGGR